jgi:hypothetical protein
LTKKPSGFPGRETGSRSPYPNLNETKLFKINLIIIQAIEAKMNDFAKMLSAQTDHYQKEMAQLEVWGVMSFINLMVKYQN